MSKHATCEEGQRSHWEGSLPSISWVMGKEVEGLEVRLRITGKEEKEEELGEGETEDASLSLSGEREFGRGELDEELVQQVRSHGLYHIAKGYIYQCAVGGIIDVSLQDAIAKMQVEKQRDEAVGPMLSQVTNDEKLQLSDALQSYISVLGAMHQDISAYQDRINEVRTSALENWDSDKNSGSQGPMVRLRGRIPKKAREILTKWAMSHQDDPYPSKGFFFFLF